MVSCLLIDQNIAERQRISALMKQLHIACHMLSEVEAGIRFCHENRPDVVLLEAAALPRAQEFLRLVRQQSKTSGRPIIILYATAASMAQMGESILNGAAEFMMVPFDLALLRFKLTQSGVLLTAAA
jgi:DNA-binding response OmpR family regulator